MYKVLGYALTETLVLSFEQVKLLRFFFFVEQRMDARKSLSSIISKKVKESPLASNIIMGLFLLVCEKMLDSEFLCPCSERREWNSLFVFLYFLCPGFIVSVLMYHVHKHGSSSSCCLIFFHTSVPVLTWLIILFLDGEYVACGLTNWSGVYEATEGSGLMRWCEPDKNTSERLSYTRTAYTISQVRSN